MAAWDLGHVLFFALATHWLIALLRDNLAKFSLFVLFFTFSGAVFFFGLSIEFLQAYQGNRSPDMMDVVRNQLGCLLAFTLYASSRLQQKRLFTFRGLQGLALLLLLPALSPLTRAVIDEQLARHQFPLLSDFETPFEKHRWVNVRQLSEETTIVRHGKKALRVQLSTAKYSGSTLFYFPGDWRGYTSLCLSVYNSQNAPLFLTLRINDMEHKHHGSRYFDRFNKEFSLQPGWNDLAIELNQVKNAPKGRQMDMEHIEGFGLFVIQQAKPIEIVLDHIFLTR